MAKRRLRAIRQATVRGTRRHYRSLDNVIGISAGSKYVRGKRLPGVECVQFFVTEKVKDKNRLKRSVPSFVYKRLPDGSIDYSVKIPTDVIVLRNLRVCCRGGNEIAFVGGEGTVTLVFRNKSANDPQVMFLTCSHVTGSVDHAPDANKTVVGGDSGCVFQGTFTHNTLQSAGELEFDIAVGVATSVGSSFVDLEVAGAAQALVSAMSTTDIEAGRVLDWFAAKSKAGQLTVESSLPTELDDVRIGSQFIRIGHLIPAKGNAKVGDSGGTVFTGNVAVGMIVARADGGWVFFHPLADAVAHLNQQLPFRLQVF
jgi:hypothetical protein